MLVLARHGSTAANEDGKIQGHLDLPLSQLGIRQSVVLGQWLKSIDLNLTQYQCSTSARARETASIVSEALGCTFTTYDALRERNFGPYEGALRAGLADRVNPLPGFRPLYDWDDLDGVESDDQILRRVVEHLDATEALWHASSSDVLLVTHAGVTQVLVRHLMAVRTNLRHSLRIPLGSSVALDVGEDPAVLIHLWPNPARDSR